MKMDRIIRSGRVITILFSLLVSVSLNADKLDVVVIADVQLPGMNQLQETIAKTVADINDKIIGTVQGIQKANKIPRRGTIKFKPTDTYHITFGYVGIIDTNQDYKGLTYLQVLNELYYEINKEINKQTQLDFYLNQNVSWPPLGQKKKIWLSLEAQPRTQKMGNDAISLVNAIQRAIQVIQEKYNCFQQSNLTIRYHISLGRLLPPLKSDDSEALLLDALDDNQQKFVVDSFKKIKLQGSNQFTVDRLRLTYKNNSRKDPTTGQPEEGQIGSFSLLPPVPAPQQPIPGAPTGAGPSRRPQQPAQGAPTGAGPSRRPQQPAQGAPTGAGPSRVPQQQPQISRTPSGNIKINNLDHPGGIQFNSLGAQDSLIAKQANGKVVYVYDIHKDPKVKGPEVGQFRIAQSGTPFNVTMDPAGSFIVVLSEGLRNDRGLFAISTDSLKANQPGLRRLQLSPHNSQATALHRMAGRWPAPTFISASAGGAARIWELKRDGNVFSYNVKHEGMNHPRNRINDAISNRNGSRTITVSDDNTAVIWDYVNRKKYTLTHQDSVSKATFSGDGMRVATSSGSRVYIWEVATGNPVISYDFSSPVQGIRFEGETLFVRLDNAIVAWKNAMKMVSGGAEAFNLVRYDQEGVRATSFAIFKDILIVGTDRGYAQVWSIGQNGQGPKSQLGKFTGPITSITFTRDGKKLAISDDNSIQVFFGS